MHVNTVIIPVRDRTVFVIDPAGCSLTRDQDSIVGYLRTHELQPLFIALTHGHFDHVSGLSEMIKAFPSCPIAIHKNDADCIGPTSSVRQSKSLEQMGLIQFLPAVSNLPAATWYLQDGMTLDSIIPDTLGSKSLSEWQVIHTPGHSGGSVCFFNETEKILLSGDTVFFHSCGRTDLYGGSETDMEASLRKLMKKIPENVLVYPGHDTAGFLFGDNF